MTTPMLRSYAMVQETHAKIRYKQCDTTNDDGRGEEHSDTCCRGECKRMAIWFRDATRGYCETHWRDYLRNHRYAVEAKSGGLCIKCRKVPTDGACLCSGCQEKQRNQMAGRGVENRSQGTCWCGRTPKKGKATCEACIANHARNVRERRDEGLCGCGEKRFGALSCCYGCWMIQLRAKDKREEAQRQAMDSWENSMLEGLE